MKKPQYSFSVLQFLFEAFFLCKHTANTILDCGNFHAEFHFEWILQLGYKSQTAEVYNRNPSKSAHWTAAGMIFYTV